MGKVLPMLVVLIVIEPVAAWVINKPARILLPEWVRGVLASTQLSVLMMNHDILIHTNCMKVDYILSQMRQVHSGKTLGSYFVPLRRAFNHLGIIRHLQTPFASLG